MNFTDLNQVAKIARLPGPPTLQGAPAGADPEPREIGYYAPSGDLVLYSGEVGYWNGIIRIGQLDTTTDLVEGRDGIQATIERA